MEVFLLTVVAIRLGVVFAGTYKVGILVDETHWIESDKVINDITTSGSTTVNFTIHRFADGNGLEATKTVCNLLEQGYSGFLSFVDCPTASVLDWQTKSRDVPHVMFISTLCNSELSEFSFKFISACDRINDALKDIVSKQPTLEFTILYDNVLNNACLQNLLSRLSKIPASSRVLNIQKDIRLELAYRYQMKHFILIATPETVNKTLIMAESLGLLSQNCSWVIYTKELLLPFNFTGLNDGRISFVRPNLPGMTENGICTSSWLMKNSLSIIEAFVEDGKGAFVKAFINLESMYGSMTGNVKCRNISSVLGHGKTLRDELLKVSFTGNTGHIGWSSDLSPETTNYQICSVENNKTTYKYMGYWENNKRLRLNNNLFANDFTDFGNDTLTIATKHLEPFVIFTDHNGTIEYSGFCFDILNELARHFKFKYKIIEPPDGMYGGLNSDGTWNGMVGMVMRGDVDFAIGPFTITSIRETVIDFTVPYTEDGVGILTKRPNDEPNKIFKMFKPFSLEVWCYIGVAIIVVGLLLCLIGYFNPSVKKAHESPQSSPEHHLNQRSLKETTWLIYGSFLEQGIDPRPTTFSGRSMLGFWWVFTILMTSTYTANLAAVLTVSIPEQPINSLNELVSQSDISPLVKSGTNIHTLFMTSQAGIYRQVWEMMGRMPKVTSNLEALEIVKKGEHAFMTDISQLEYIVRQECEAYLLADEIFNNAGLGFVLPENAIFKDAFNLNIMKMQEAGMTERWKEEWWPTIDSCSLNSRTSGAQSLGMDSLAGLFYVYIGIAGISILVFILNLLYTKMLAAKVHPYLLNFSTIIRSRSPTQTKLLTSTDK